jgi:multidrug efflux pump subunit AcrA (membrane-fusion protein)
MAANFRKNFPKRLKNLPSQPRVIYKKSSVFVQRRPLTAFFVVLLLLFGLIVAGSFLTPKPKTAEKPEIVKSVQTYKITESPKVTLQAKIEKSGVIKINALAPGVIQKINFKEGETFKKGSVLVNMSSNYQGGNAASIQVQLAQKQYQNAKDIYQNQKDTLELQKRVTNATESNAAQLRDITNKSLSETQSLINLNQSILDTLNANGATDVATQMQRAQIQSGLNQLRQSLRQAEFQAASDKPPAELVGLQKEVALKQLENQQKSLDLGLEVSRLQVALAQINAAMYFPAAPFAGVVQRIHVKEGQSINPGTPLMTISATVDPITAIVNLPHNLAGAVSNIEPSKIYIDSQPIEVFPDFITTEATDGTLYSVIYTIPDFYSANLVEGGTITVEIPVGIDQTASATAFIPLDSVFQSASESLVLVVDGEKAISKKIELGDVFGSFVEVKSGLSADDQVILNRNILSGDKVTQTQ